jgi:hypothetical protein
MRRTPARRGRPAAGGVSRTLLDAETDFTYLGSHVLAAASGNAASFTKGLTHFYDGATLTFLTMGFAGDPIYTCPSSFTLSGSPTGGGGTASTVTNWIGTDVGGEVSLIGAATHLGIWWEDPADPDSDFWICYTPDYPQDPITLSHVMSTSLRKLVDDGTATDWRGFFGFEGVGSRSCFGTVRKVPTHFRTANSTGPYVWFGGGYTSLADSGLAASFGPMWVFGPDPRGYANGDYLDQTANIPDTDFKIGADFRSGSSGTDWGTDYANRTKDRVSRPVRAGYENYADAGDPRLNPSRGTSTVDTNGTAVTRTAGIPASRFQDWWAGYSGTVGGVTESKGAYNVTINGVEYTVASVADDDNLTLTTSAGVQTGVNCLGPPVVPQIGVLDSGFWDYAGGGAPNDPTGYARGSWVDSSYSCTDWVDNDAGTRPKHGIISVWTFNDGKLYYDTSELTNQGRRAILQIYDPTHVAEVIAGTRDPFDLQPTSMLDLTDILMEFGGGGNQETGGVVGCTIDYTVTPNRLYLLHAVTNADNAENVARVHVFEVAA